MATHPRASSALSDDEIRLLGEAILHNTVLGCDFEDARFVSEQAGHTIPAAIDEMVRIRNAIAEVPGISGAGRPLLHEGGVYIPFLDQAFFGEKSPDSCNDQLRSLHVTLTDLMAKLEANSKAAEPRPIADVIECNALRTVIEEMAIAKAQVWRLEAGRKVFLPVAEKAWLATRIKKEPESKEILALIRGVFLSNGANNFVIVQARMFVQLPICNAEARKLIAEDVYLEGTIVSTSDGWKIDAERPWSFLTAEQFKARQRDRRSLAS
jgi:hypothetical protein